VWAGRYGGAGRDGGLALAAAPNGDLLLVGASAPAPTAAALGLASSPNSTAAAASSASLFFARLAGGAGLGAVAATSVFPAGAAPPAAARLALGSGSATAVAAYAVAGPAELQLSGQALSVGAAEAGLVVIEARSPPRWSQSLPIPIRSPQAACPGSGCGGVGAPGGLQADALPHDQKPLVMLCAAHKSCARKPALRESAPPGVDEQVDLTGALAGGQPLLVTAARAGGAPQLLLGDLLQAHAERCCMQPLCMWHTHHAQAQCSSGCASKPRLGDALRFMCSSSPPPPHISRAQAASNPNMTFLPLLTTDSSRVL